jgi:hypothetical protein
MTRRVGDTLRKSNRLTWRASVFTTAVRTQTTDYLVVSLQHTPRHPPPVGERQDAPFAHSSGRVAIDIQNHSSSRACKLFGILQLLELGRAQSAARRKSGVEAMAEYRLLAGGSLKLTLT